MQPTPDPWSVLRQCLERISSVFDRQDVGRHILASDAVAHRLLGAVLGADLQVFLATSTSAPAGRPQPSDDTRARILAKAVAGMVAVFSRLSKLGPGAHGAVALVVERETASFALSEQRRALLDVIEKSDIFGACQTRLQVADLIVGAVEAHEDHGLVRLYEEAEVAMATDVRLRNEGLPSGFQFVCAN